MAKSWEKKCDELTKKIGLFPGKCMRCGATKDNKQMHHHHLITRKVLCYRHCPENIVCLCANCHTLAPYSAHNDLTAFREWLKTTPRWAWYEAHTVKDIRVIANQEIEIYKHMRIKHIGDEAEFEILTALYNNLLGD